LPVRIRVSKPIRRRSGGPSKKAARLSKIAFFVLAAAPIAAFIVTCFTYAKYAKLADEKLKQGPFPDVSLLFAAPQVIGIGDPGSRLELANRLRESGYGEDARSNRIGWYHLRPDAIEVFPGDHSSTTAEPGVLRFENDKLASIIALSDNSPRTEFTLEPQILTALYDKNREKRRLVKYDDIPAVLVNAVISIEDKRFFQHSGFDPIRIVKALWVDFRERRKDQGASTLTQQLAKNIWLSNRKTWMRKFDELLITIHLEQKLTKQEIFEYYANMIPLGQRGSFAIRGFGEAAQAFFGKDIRQLTLPEAATLAGLIQIPSYRNPVRWPERAKARRNVVLRAMLENNYITEYQYRDAIRASLVLSRQGPESADAPYFVDLVNDRLGDRFQDRDFQASGMRIYTTLDADLQRDATAAVAEGMREVNSILAKRRKRGEAFDAPQVALICIDPHTGEVKALVGGRNYGMSQLNHAVAKRPSGSVFKPFVYAAALSTGLVTNAVPITASTMLADEPHAFEWAGKTYEPTDYHKNAWEGQVLLPSAFAKSLNVPAVEVAEQTGYDAVAALAHKAGLPDIRATPAMALGAYSVTPLEMAGAFTIFANEGVRVQPQFLSRIADKNGQDVWTAQPETKKVLDPRVSFLITGLMQDVLRWGTGAGVQARGFILPAAGKTGTSHDAWFAGYTSKLLCVVWVGLDDYQDIKLEGAKAALPIWTSFMKRAHQHREYRGVMPFEMPEGVVSVQIDSDTGGLATSTCPRSVVHTEYFLTGTQPITFCPTHLGGTSEIAGWEALPPPPPLRAEGANGQVAVVPAVNATADPNSHDRNAQKDKKGLLDKLKGIFH
jgi:penicillin-binding protein 1B